MKRVYLFAVLIALPFFGMAQTIHQINTSKIEKLDQIAPFSEGLAAVRQGNQWGFINEEGI